MTTSDRKIRQLQGRHRFGTYAVTGIVGLMGAGAGVERCEPPTPVPAPVPAPTPEPAPAPQPAPAPAPASVNDEVVALVNEQRAANGLAALATNGLLLSAAEGHSADQAARNDMGHTGSDGSSAGDRITAAGYSWSAWGENVAAGYATAADVMNGWMNSPGHRDNILSSSVTEIGVAAVPAADGTPYWTMVLAAPA